MRRVIFIFAIAALFWVSPANAHLVYKPTCATLKCRLASQQQNLKHAKFLSHYGKGATRVWGKQAVGWLSKEITKTKEAMSRREMPLVDNCLRGIIALENRAWDPTLDYGGGHGNVYEAYGIPQANPGYKMKSAGWDWRTNPATQLRWMIKYVNDRYGGSCQAYHHRITVGYY